MRDVVVGMLVRDLWQASQRGAGCVGGLGVSVSVGVSVGVRWVRCVKGVSEICGGGEVRDVRE